MKLDQEMYSVDELLILLRTILDELKLVDSAGVDSLNRKYFIDLKIGNIGKTMKFILDRLEYIVKVRKLMYL